MSVRHVTAWPLTNGEIIGPVVVPFIAPVEGATITTVPTEMVVVTAPLVTVLVLAAGPDETSKACVEAGELRSLEEVMELKMETRLTLEMEEVKGPEGVEEEAAEEDG